MPGLEVSESIFNLTPDEFQHAKEHWRIHHDFFISSGKTCKFPIVKDIHVNPVTVTEDVSEGYYTNDESALGDFLSTLYLNLGRIKWK